ncbi:hypothetical protein Vadar_006434 [Vaccinium darrowii]|uniref:Uncharacterized protein n=1 Tax=Vaccinium darrowii TaxID=229202 RepID=A0ACB7XNY9_9ERIC|nr:hypothetical protein Vadar_006434 [Vaccinium darrowii]
MVSVASCVRRCSFHLLNVFLAAVLIMFAVYHTTDTRSSALDYQPTREIIVGSVSKIRDDSVMERLVDDTANESRVEVSANESRVEVSVSGGRVDSVLSGCDLFSGKWVYDNKSYPLYKDRECGFMFDDLACEKYGRKDLDYQRWRWQPHACDLPRFEGKAFLERIRGKRIVFVGDSINRNQWVSMVCLVESSIPNLSPEVKYMHLEGSLYTFKATEYNASIDFYWSPMLVESNNDNPSNHTGSNRMVKIGAIEKHATQWGDADLLVFNSYLWWRTLKLKVLLGGSFEDPVYKEVKMLRCYKMALQTWSKWLDTHINRTKTQLFFVSSSATHSRAEEWGMPKDENCFGETKPISKDGYWGSGSDPKMMQITEAEISKLKTRGLKIQMLNITQLSEYRKDGHPSVYRKLWRPLSAQQLSDPRNYADCSHWCLPGVPDVWNELLSAYLLHQY